MPTDDQSHAFAGQRLHLVGIGGSGMRGLAELLIRRGAIVSGSDRSDSGALQRLRRDGASVFVGQRAEHVPEQVDTVVVSAAISDDNPELIAARRRGVRVLKYAQALGEVMKCHRGIAICGTHGKSTTTAMTAFQLRRAGLDPTFIIGAQVDQLGGGCGVGNGPHFVVEACEYDRSFLSLNPYYTAILNIEEDHLDCYRDIHDITEAFRAFASLVPADGLLIVNGESRQVQQAVRGVDATVETFGKAAGCTWRAENLTPNRGRFAFDLLLRDKLIARPTMYLPGLHNVYNALACVALCHHAGVEIDALVDGLAEFRGARRRMQLKGRAMGITVVDDYAHHPTEIVTTLRAIRDFYEPRRLICVFQPHQHSRTQFLLNDFARSFGAAHLVLMPDIYFARDSQEMRDQVNSRDLVSQICQGGGQAVHLPTFDQLEAHLRENLRDGDLVVTMGAGNIYQVADNLCTWLNIGPTLGEHD